MPAQAAADFPERQGPNRHHPAGRHPRQEGHRGGHRRQTPHEVEEA